LFQNINRKEERGNYSRILTERRREEIVSEY
jgi:hypothetical protein